MRVLVVGDDPTELGALIEVLGSAGMEVVTAYGARAALRLDTGDVSDVVVVGAKLNARDFYGFVAGLRSRTQAPMLVLGRWSDEARLAAVLDAGADDVAAARCGRLELVARVRALGRRSARSVTEPSAEAAGLSVDTARREAIVHGRQLKLTPIEFELLASLASRPGNVVDHRSMLRAAWPEQHDADPNLMRTHLAHLNGKLNAAGHPGVRNVRRSGYALRVSQ